MLTKKRRVLRPGETKYHGVLTLESEGTTKKKATKKKVKKKATKKMKKTASDTARLMAEIRDEQAERELNESPRIRQFTDRGYNWLYWSYTDRSWAEMRDHALGLVRGGCVRQTILYGEIISILQVVAKSSKGGCWGSDSKGKYTEGQWVWRSQRIGEDLNQSYGTSYSSRSWEDQKDAMRWGYTTVVRQMKRDGVTVVKPAEDEDW
jgi:hypothetical protein